MKLAIIDYGMGNVGSVRNAITKLGIEVEITSDPAILRASDAFILPGVGAFPHGMQNIRERSLDTLLQEQVIDQQKPVLGICLGMQLMAVDSCEQGRTNGLGWIEGHVVPFMASQQFPAPHVGWNNVKLTREDADLGAIDENAHFFFDHSFYFEAEDPESVLGTCQYQLSVASILRKGHIFATQFHPEKSQRNGLKLLRGFTNYVVNRLN